MPIRHKIVLTPIQIEDIKYKYCELHWSARDIANDYGASNTFISKLLRSWEVVRSQKEATKVAWDILSQGGRQKRLFKAIPKAVAANRHEKTISIPLEELKYKYCVSEHSLEDLAEEYECSSPTIKNRLLSMGVVVRGIKESHKTLSYSTAWNKMLKGKRDKKRNIGRENRRANNILRYQNPEERIKTGLATKRGFERIPNYTEKISRIRKESWANHPEWRIRMQEVSKEYWSCPENRSTQSLKAKQRWQDPAWRQLQEEERKLRLSKNPEYAKEWFSQMARAARNTRPTKPEKILLEMLNSLFPNEWQFVGDGDFVIGKLCPDFINIDGKKQVIEMFGVYWHKYSLKPNSKLYRTEEGRKAIFKEHGYDMLVVWDYELKDRDALGNKLLQFASSVYYQNHFSSPCPITS
jgi:hypothetical protein